jgi:hypothetical protein
MEEMNMEIKGITLEVGMKLRQNKVLEDYGFNYVGREFTITDIYPDSIRANGNGVRFGATEAEVEEYFELVLPEIEEDWGIKEEVDIRDFTTDKLLLEIRKRTVRKGLSDYSNMDLLKELRDLDRENIKVIHTYGVGSEQIFTIIVNE